MAEEATHLLTAEQFDKLVSLIEAAVHRAVVNGQSVDPTRLDLAARVFERAKKAARDALVEPS